jgi:hypothetical protein
MTFLQIFFLVWVIFGIIACAHHFAYFQRRYVSIREESFVSDQRSALLWALSGPFGLLVTLLAGGLKYGFLLPYTRAAKRDLQKHMVLTKLKS